MEPIQQDNTSSKRYLLLKLLLIVVIAFGGLSVTVTPTAQATDALAAVKITNSKQAIERAKQLKLLPEAKANITTTKETKPIEAWTISFAVGKNNETERINESGTIKLSATTGELLHFNEEVNLDDGLCAYPCNEPNKPLAKPTETAINFFNKHNWKVDAQWKLDDYPFSMYEFDRHSPDQPIFFDRTNDGIRYPSNGIMIRVQADTGEVYQYSFRWTKMNFVLPKKMISAAEAGRIFFDAFEPPLLISEDPDSEGPDQPLQSKLIYSSTTNYYSPKTRSFTLDANGAFLEGQKPETPTQTDNTKAKYPIEYAKHRILSLFELEMIYLETETGKAEPFYSLKVKPGVPIFHTEPHPSIDANNGRWINFLHDPLTVKLPTASDWLIDLAAPPKEIDYKAAVVWDNELVELENAPIISKGTTLVPFRELLKKLGATIGYDHAKRQVTASKGDVTVELNIDSKTALINGKAHILIAPAQVTQGRTYIPARVILEAFGAKVDWNSESRLVIVRTDSTLPKLTELQLDRFRLHAQMQWEEKHWK